MTDDNLVAVGYDAVYDAIPHSPTFRSLWAEHASGDGYPPEYDSISFVTATEMRAIARDLALPAGGTLVDLACGAGGPGLWLASLTGASLAGVDISGVAVARARARAAAVAATSATFVQGSFAATGLATGAADGVVSSDALQYAPDKAAAFAEAARVLRPGGRLAFTAFEVEPDRVAGLPVLGDDPCADFRPLLEANGFSTTQYDETPGWHARVAAAYGAVLAAADVLTDELGAPAYLAMASEMTLTQQLGIYRRRVLAVAERV
jgi:SAM-dependent methyltransferase